MSQFQINEIIEKLAQCIGMEKASETINRICLELGYRDRDQLSSNEMVSLCDRMEDEGGFMKMMASVLKIQAIMDT